MAVINHEAALARAGANVTGWWSQTLFFARRYPLGVVGAVIVLVFLFTAAFAGWIAPTDPTSTKTGSKRSPTISPTASTKETAASNSA